LEGGGEAERRKGDGGVVEGDEEGLGALGAGELLVGEEVGELLCAGGDGQAVAGTWSAEGEAVAFEGGAGEVGATVAGGPADGIFGDDECVV